MIRTIVEKVDKNIVSIILNQFKAFDWVDHGLLEAVLSAAVFGRHFHSWLWLIYASPRVMEEVNGLKAETLILTRSIRQRCPL